MTNNISLSAKQTNLDDLLAKRVVLTVPHFQRTYSWDRDQFEELWNDIENGIKQGWDHHLDQITIVPDESKEPTEEQIIDGQQRLTTLSILLCAMRDVYDNRHGENNKQSNVIDQLLTTQDLDGNPVRQLQLLSESGDDNAYKAVYDGKPSNADGQVEVAYEYFKNKLRARNTEEINEVRKYVQDKLTFIRTEVGELVHAYVMFETTNSRGMDLGPLEMAKAILLRMAHRSDSDEKEVRRLWLNILERSQEVDSGKPTRPIKDVLAISDRFSAPTELSGRQFVGHIRSVFNNEVTDVESALREIDKRLADYETIKTGSVNRFSKRKNARINSLIHQFNAKNSHAGIILYWLFENVDDADRIISALDLGVTLLTRLVLADKTAWQKRDAMHSVYNQLKSGKELEQSFKTVIENDTPADKSLEIEIQNREFKKNDSTRNILYRVESDHFGGQAVSDTSYPSAGEDYEIEHIAPMQAFSADKYTPWKRVLNHSPEKFEKERKRLGNITLLRESQNIQAGTKPFEQKKKIYKNSDFAMARELTEIDSWGFESINDRSAKMAKLVVSSFSIDSETVATPSKTDGGESLHDYL